MPRRVHIHNSFGTELEVVRNVRVHRDRGARGARERVVVAFATEPGTAAAAASVAAAAAARASAASDVLFVFSQ